MAGIQFKPVGGLQGGASGGGAAVPTVGISGGGGASSNTPMRSGAEWFDRGMRADFGGDLPGFLNEVFAAPLAVAKQEREWKGYTDAAAGVTAEEIRAQQPWYTKIFGPTQYESGAIAFENQKKASDLIRDWTLRMPELRQMPAEQVSAQLREQMNSMMGNNPFANAVLQKSLLTQYAPLLEQHGKERIAWQQSQLLKSQVENFQSNSATYQLLMSKAATLGTDQPMDINTAKQLEAAKSSLFDALTTGQFQTDDSVKSFIMTGIRSAMRSGEFYTVEAMMDENILGALPIETAEQIQKAYITAKAQYKNRFTADNPDFEKMMAKAAASRHLGIGGEPMLAQLREINSTYSALTGDPDGFYDSAQMSAYAGDATSSWLRRFERQEDKMDRLKEKAADNAAKAEVEARNTAQLQEFFVSGSLGEAINMKGVERGDADRASTARFSMLMGEQKVDQAMGNLVYNFNNTKGSYKNEQLAQQMQTNLQNSMDEQVSDAFMVQHKMWKALYTSPGYAMQDGDVVLTDAAQGQAAAIGYYGETLNRKMVEFDQKLTAGMTSDRAYATTFGPWVAAGRPDFRGIERDDQKQATKAFLGAIRGESAGMFSRMFGNGFKLHPSAEAQLAQAVGPYYEQLDAGLLPEQRAKAAMNLAKQGGRIEIVGGQFLHWNRNQQPLTKYMGDPDGERTSLLFDTVLRERLKSVGTTPDGNSIVINRLPDEKGDPVYAVHVETSDGFYNVDIRGSDLTSYDEKKLRARREQMEAPRQMLPIPKPNSNIRFN
ncbi:internal virion protein [Xylella phage Paz]|uniref:Internal virion protein n=1 Tax=Xylella phage Paz TaxID=1415145 RepID=V5Q7N1_9CAUD|nr:internal virion protein [Xylella phage Paz]AHB12134.1 internal virion protein [Xylella phage Paz]